MVALPQPRCAAEWPACVALLWGARAPWTEAERAAWRPPSGMPPSAWARAWRTIDARISVSGTDERWGARAGYVYLDEPMDSFADPDATDLTLVFAPQTGKSSAVENMLGWAVDEDPGPAMIVYPSRDLSRGISHERLMVFFRRTPRLARHITANADDFSTLVYRLRHVTIRLVGSNSPAQISAYPERDVFQDEMDKFRDSLGDEGAASDVADKRTRAFGSAARRVKTSTPTKNTRGIWPVFMAGDRRERWVPCPRCGRFHVLDWHRIGGLKDDAGALRTPDEVLALGCAFYECPHCGGRIADAEKPAMCDAGRWLPWTQSVDEKGRVAGAAPRTTHRSYHLSALYSPRVTWSHVGAAWLKTYQLPDGSMGNEQDKTKLRDFCNATLAEPWYEIASVPVEDSDLEKRKRPYKFGTVPEGAVFLTMGIDWQLRGRYWEVLALGARKGFVSSGGIVHAGYTAIDQDLVAALRAEYVCEATGEKLQVGVPFGIGLVDARYAPDQVHAFCESVAMELGWWILQPAIGLTNQYPLQPVSWRSIDVNPRTGQRWGVKGMVQYQIGTGHMKDEASRAFRAEDTGILIPADFPPHLLAQYASEYKDDKGHWQARPGRPNHLWDCHCLAIAASHSNPHWLRMASAGIEPPPPAPTGTAPPAPKIRPARPLRRGGGGLRTRY